ncbi:MAG: monovalent cation/H+ antiporter subunit D [Gemmobacter sp.]
MNHAIVMAALLPGLVGALIVLAMRNDLTLARVFSLASNGVLVVLSLALLVQASTGEPQAYFLGNWPAPFGIVLVLDRLSALLVALTAILALVVLLYVIGTGWDARGRHFHALWQFQLMGVCGAFLTGDAFNLFVFFEILLIASYGLMIHGGGGARVRAGVQYVGYNLLGSTLFLFALGTLYGVTGTLNIADMAGRMAELPDGDAALARVGAVLLLLVFAVKGALVPLQFWLPATYALAPGPVAALFAIMTKVGAYAVIRFYTLVFPADLPATGPIIADLLLPAALATLAIGMIGVLGATGLARLAAFAAIGSMGTLFVAVSAFTPEATAAALYYLVHSTIAGALLFLVADMVIARRGSDSLRAALPPVAQNGLVAALFFAAAIAMAGMPPLSGFLGKLLVLDALGGRPDTGAIWAAVLVTSLVAVVGMARAGSVLFWKAHATGDAPAPAPAAALPMVAAFALLGLLALQTVMAGPAMAWLERTAEQIHDGSGYIAANRLSGGEEEP